MSSDYSNLIARVESILERVEAVLPPAVPTVDCKSSTAVRCRHRVGEGLKPATWNRYHALLSAFGGGIAAVAAICIR